MAASTGTARRKRKSDGTVAPPSQDELPTVVAQMKAQMERMQSEMNFRLDRIESLERRCVAMQKEIDDMKRREWRERAERIAAEARNNNVGANEASDNEADGGGDDDDVGASDNEEDERASNANKAAAGNNNSDEPRVNRTYVSGITKEGSGMIRQAEEDIMSMIQSRRKKQKWPLRRNRADNFATDPELNRLRLFSSMFLKHEQKHGNAKQTGFVNKNEVKACALCSSGNAFHTTVFHCSLCAVPLCRKKMEGFDMSCHDAWHTVEDLGEERRRRKEATIYETEKKKERKDAKKYEYAEAIDKKYGYAEAIDADYEDGEESC